MTTELQDSYASNPVEACKRALQLTQSLGGEARMEEINRLLAGHGVEAIRGEWQNGYWCDIVADFVNFGDTYDTTVLREREDNGNSKFIVTCFGDWVESNSERLQIA